MSKENVFKNSVEWIGHYGSDQTIACSAWTSTSRELTQKKIDRIGHLIKEVLYSNRHDTPLEKSMIHFLVDSEIASHIHMLKHRIAVPINGESARYKEIKEDKFYIPEDWPEDWKNKLIESSNKTNELYHQALSELEPIIGRKRAKESARFFKQYNSQIMVDISFNMRSFAHFINLRKDEHAQKEIREIAEVMLDMVKNIEGNPFKHTIEAIEKYKDVRVDVNELKEFKKWKNEQGE